MFINTYDTLPFRGKKTLAIKKTALIFVSITSLALIGIVLAVLSSGVLVAQQSVSTNGALNGNSVSSNSGAGNGNIASSVNIGVYTDAAATSNCTTLNWGNLNSGDTVSQTVYVKNTGNTAETLSMSTSSWTPSSATSSLTLTWNQQGTSVPAGSVVPATLTLTAASNTGNLTDFSFNIVISGSG